MKDPNLFFNDFQTLKYKTGLKIASSITKFSDTNTGNINIAVGIVSRIWWDCACYTFLS